MSIKTFRFTVWSSLNPETIVYQESGYSQPSYERGRNGFVRYTLENPLILPAGTYYFGWEKISDTPLNVGWDVNNDNSDKVFYNASGFWVNTSFTGSLMLRPVFGTYPDETVSIKTIDTENTNSFILYPNPANNFFYINTNQPIKSVEIFNIEGKQVLQSNNKTNFINISDLNPGLYIVLINYQNKTARKKLIITRP
jgi:hypothetical protein